MSTMGIIGLAMIIIGIVGGIAAWTMLCWWLLSTAIELGKHDARRGK